MTTAIPTTDTYDRLAVHRAEHRLHSWQWHPAGPDRVTVVGLIGPERTRVVCEGETLAGALCDLRMRCDALEVPA